MLKVDFDIGFFILKMHNLQRSIERIDLHIIILYLNNFKAHFRTIFICVTMMVGIKLIFLLNRGKNAAILLWWSTQLQLVCTGWLPAAVGPLFASGISVQAVRRTREPCCTTAAGWTRGSGCVLEPANSAFRTAGSPAPGFLGMGLEQGSEAGRWPDWNNKKIAPIRNLTFLTLCNYKISSIRALKFILLFRKEKLGYLEVAKNFRVYLPQFGDPVSEISDQNF